MARFMLSVCFVLFFVKVSALSPSYKRKSVFVFLELNKNRLIKKCQEQRIQIAIS